MDYHGVDAANKLLWVNRGTNAAPTSGQSGAYTKLTYDGNGCVTQRERRYDGGLLKTLDFLWDGDNRLREIKEGATSRFTASYNGDGLRVGKTDSWTGAHDYSWGSQGIVWDSSGSTVLTPGLAQRSNGVDRFSQEDWIGSARYLTDSTGNGAPSALRYDAFGNRTALAGPSYPTEFQFASQWGYQTEYQDGSDPGLGINYLQQRYYDPALGRFLSRDPLGFAGGLNLYDYAGGNPVNAVDPSGEDPRQNFRNAMSLIGTGIGMVMGGFGGGAGGAAGGSLVGPVGTIGGGVAGGVEGGIEGGALGGLLGLETAELIIQGADLLGRILQASPAPRIHEGRQGKHQTGHTNFQPGKGLSELTHPDPQGLLNKFAGKGTRVGQREYVDFGEVIGIYVDKDGNRIATTRGTIHYMAGDTGAHIVPAPPVGP